MKTVDECLENVVEVTIPASELSRFPIHTPRETMYIVTSGNSGWRCDVICEGEEVLIPMTILKSYIPQALDVLKENVDMYVKEARERNPNLHITSRINYLFSKRGSEICGIGCVTRAYVDDPERRQQLEIFMRDNPKMRRAVEKIAVE